MSKKYSNSDLVQILKKRYDEEFEIKSNQFVFQVNKFQFVAYQRENPEIKAFGSYIDNQSEIEENYLQMLNCYQGKEYLKNLLDDYYDKYAVDVNVMSPLQEKQEGSLPPFPELAQSESADVIANFRVYLFDTVSNENEGFLSGIVEAANHFKGSFYGTFTFTIYFWDSEFLKGKNLDEMKFGFNYNSDSYDDNLSAKGKYIRQELTFEFDSSEKPEITLERIQELVAPYKKGKQYNRL
ncbi:hypothetical protein GCM10009122_53460 [Fulvivirga kasyanovii]|uniref:Uncharacterized protein n=1 Tax=Fulvivirga kasyanovii TaxID=396812 RepID=A0ABW9RK67_9BACT|nr:hypothetical protein [Fulvivirga kasyanovii]MTI24482.1 hypothetical protein [Fulvivirga kasyanovii]